MGPAAIAAEYAELFKTRPKVKLQLAIDSIKVLTETAAVCGNYRHWDYYDEGDNATTEVETGLYNLTKDEAPCLMHFSKDRTEQWLPVRLQLPDADKKK